MWKRIAVALIIAAGGAVSLRAQAAEHRRKRLLAIGEEKGYRHEAVTTALATIHRLGRESGLWDTVIRTDTEALTKQKLEYNAKNLNDFDGIVFYTGGKLEMTPAQKADLLSFVHDDGKGFVGIHSATITFADWPEYIEMIGLFSMSIRGRRSTLPSSSRIRSSRAWRSGPARLRCATKSTR